MGSTFGSRYSRTTVWAILSATVGTVPAYCRIVQYTV